MVKAILMESILSCLSAVGHAKQNIFFALLKAISLPNQTSQVVANSSAHRI